MSILQKLFGNAQPQAPSPAQAANPALNQPGQPGNIPQQNPMPANPANPTTPAGTTPQEPANTPPKPAEGLDKFNDMWNIPADQQPKAPESPFAGVTPDAIKQVAGKMDFSKVVTAEMMQAISAGGEGAVAAMMQAMNATSQEVYASSAQASMSLIDKALEKQRTELQASLPGLIKNNNVTENLRNTNPVFKHPAAKPVLDMFTQQLQAKHPTADAATIQAQAQEFLLSLATAANPPKPTEAAPGAKPEVDWDEFL